MAAETSGAETSDDYGNTLQTATELRMNSSLSGRIDYGTDEDWFRLVFNQRGTMSLYTTGPTDTKGAAYINDLDSRIFSDDDSGEGLNFSFRIFGNVLPDNVTVYLQVTGFDEETTGPYTVHFNLTPD